MITLDEARERIDSKVVYRAPHVAAHEPGEEGVITSVNSAYVFVQYKVGGNGIATPPNCLEFVSQ